MCQKYTDTYSYIYINIYIYTAHIHPNLFWQGKGLLTSHHREWLVTTGNFSLPA